MKKLCCIAVILVIALATGGCVQVKQFAPHPVETRNTLRGLPASLVTVRVQDLRAQEHHSVALMTTIKRQFAQALSRRPITSTPTGDLYVLKIDVIKHKAYFTPGIWNASTKLRAKLISPRNQVLGTWTASGTAHKFNLLGYATARAASQDSYTLAVENMLSILSGVAIGHH